MKEKLREGLHLERDTRFSEDGFEFLRVRLRLAFIEIADREIADREIEERVQPRALERA